MTVHSKYGFSGASRYIEGACPASVRMSEGYPSGTNPAAELGTAAHELGEFCLQLGLNPHECLGFTFNDHIVDENMIDASAVYVNFGRSLALQAGVKPLLEQRVTMTSLGRSDVFGTGDYLLFDKRKLHVVDYKHGYGIVEPTSPQLPGYGVSTLDTFNMWDQIDEVMCTIIQPRASHVNGPIRSVMYSKAEMIDWQQKFQRSIVLAEDPNELPVAGPHCKYCPARGNCRARLERTIELVYLDKPLKTLLPEEIELIYEEIDVISTHLEAIKMEALKLGREGRKFDKYKLVNSIVRAKCEDEKGFIEAAVNEGVDTSKLYDQKLISMTKAKKLVSAKTVNQFYVKPPSSTTLVKKEDNRPAVRVGSATGIFDNINQSTAPKAVGIFSNINQ